MIEIVENRYGKSRVRLVKVTRHSVPCDHAIGESSGTSIGATRA